MDSLKGQLLIAAAALVDPHFRRSVVLVTEHEEDGALGLILNRPAETTVGEAVPALEHLVEPGAPVYVGGPVEPSSVLVLAEFAESDDAEIETIFDDVGFVPGNSDLDDVGGTIARARVFAGYAGWSGGQLEEELDADGWIVERATREDVFGPSDELWSDVLRRKGGPYALLSTIPPDPSLN